MESLNFGLITINIVYKVTVTMTNAFVYIYFE